MSIKDNAILEILSLIELQEQEDNEGFTAKELRTRLGYGEGKVNDIIDRLMSEEYLVCLRVPRINRAGILCPVIGYKLTAKAHDKAAAES